MKNIAIIIVSLLASVIAFANDFDKGLISNSSNRVVTIDYSEFEDVTTKLSILNMEGEVVYSQSKATPSKLSKRFFIKESVGNEFAVQVENDLKVVSAHYKIENGQAVLVSSESSVKPVFRLNDRMATINFLNSDEDKVSVYVFDEQGTVMYENHLVEQNIQQAFDLNKYTGRYVILTVVKGAKKFSHAIQL